MPIHLVFTAALFMQTPTDAVERSWGQLARSPHFSGSWHVEIDGHVFEGDWAVADTEQTFTRFGHQRWIHLLSSRTGAYCAIDAERSERIRCADGTQTKRDLYLPEATKLDPRLSVDLPLVHHVWRNGTNYPRRGGAIRTTLRPATATLAQEQMVFGRIHQTSLASKLRATATVVASALVLKMPHNTVTPLLPLDSGSRSNATVARPFEPYTYEQQVVGYEATIRIGPRPTDVAIESREVTRHVEACVSSQYMGSCMPHPPTCTVVR